ncbi:MAG TPA: flagellar export chaperone FliS [Egibacteraceae bacterium]|nr:flagellar export chaperone FliS [Egibacteraceae bacterium]
MSLQAARNRYIRDAVSTVSPARLLTMLYDALVSDLELAEKAITERDLQAAHDRLVRAQEIVLELQSSLDLNAWDGAAGLMSLYQYMHRELVTANVRKDVKAVVAVRKTAEPLRDAWHQAAAATAGVA